jgi:hypothetical protein
VGYFPFLWLGNSVLELAISPSFFRPIFFFFFLKVERGAGAAFRDTAVQRNTKWIFDVKIEKLRAEIFLTSREDQNSA